MINARLEKVKDFLETEIAPIANELDADYQQLVEVFSRFKKLGALGLLVPQELGGWGADHHALVRYNMLLANYSAALLFLQAQHQYVVMDLSKYPITEEVKALFSGMAEKQQAVGVCLSAKKTTAIEDGDSLRLSVTMPWVSGYGFFDKILISFLYNDDLCYALLPFKNYQSDDGTIQCSERIETVVVNAVSTVRIDLNNWPIKKSELLCTIPPDEYLPAVPHPTIYNFAGVSQALLKEVERSRHFDAEFVQAKYHALQQQLNHYIKKISQPINEPFSLRAQGRRLANSCSEFARLTLSGSALLPHAKVQRLCREVWLYSAIAFQIEQLQAYLADS